uniref:EB domain-containing protein n=1 Tax=Romanomermis culicivorax TaxID=13658 RepID=A0A915IUM9_ROMCU
MIPFSAVPTAFNETCHYRGKWVTCNGTHLQKECDQTPGSATYAKLGDTCRTNADCTVAYSYCNHRACSCRKSFVAYNGLCQPTAQFSIMLPWVVQTMELIFVSNMLRQEDVDQRAPKRPGRHPGHCCPNPTAGSTYAPVCPESRKVYDTCEISREKDETKKQCPPETQCLRMKSETTGVCCRLPCNLSYYVNFDGQCYALNLELDSPCDFNEQCPNYAVSHLFDEIKNSET